mmetsp:Transcript_101275/g.241539  ORF Transcript_101275/g.241539 Transcript_101275/m.241539 type:complete len:86 (+) Transcript_101275:241-498(+)
MLEYVDIQPQLRRLRDASTRAFMALSASSAGKDGKDGRDAEASLEAGREAFELTLTAEAAMETLLLTSGGTSLSTPMATQGLDRG